MAPSNKPSLQPSTLPSQNPSTSPSDLPSKKPSISPSDKPSKIPSNHPSQIPSTNPSKHPSFVLTSVYFGDSEYTLNPTPLTWVQHEAQAVSWGGHLASVTSVEEDSFIQSLLGSDEVWLGAEKAGSTGTFYWTDRASWNYYAYGSGEPNGDGNCLLKGTTGTWLDAQCSGRYFGIYKQVGILIYFYIPFCVILH